MRPIIDFFTTLARMDAGQLLGHCALLALLGFGAWAFVRLIQAAIDLYNALEESRYQNKNGEKK